MNETEFSRNIENLILTYIKDEPDVNINEEYIINDKSKRYSVKVSIVEV